MHLCPDAEEVKNLYKNITTPEIVETILLNLRSATVLNKKEHTIQFLNLLFKESVRLKLENRKKLLLGNFPILVNRDKEDEVDLPIEQYGLI